MGQIKTTEPNRCGYGYEHRDDGFATSTVSPSSGVRPLWPTLAGISVCCLIVFGAAGLFVETGSSQATNSAAHPNRLAGNAGADLKQAATPAQSDPQQVLNDIAILVARLEDKLQANPDNAEGWRLLGWSYYTLERYRNAAEAYRRSSELRTGDAIVKSLYGEALVKAAHGAVTAEAQSVFEAALAIDPNDVRARYFAGVAQQQAGQAQEAVMTWIDLLKIAPADATWAIELRQRVARFASSNGINVAGTLPDQRNTARPVLAQATTDSKGPTAEDIENAQQMTPEARMAMVRGMVEGLANRLKESPDDPDGWIRLIRSWLVLEETEFARTAFSDAMQAFAQSPKTQARIKRAAQELGLPKH